jgi:lysophospholipase L1-like esterase
VKYPDWKQKTANEFFHILKKKKNMVKKKNIDFYFFYLPEYDRYSQNLEDDKTYNDYEKVLNKISSFDIKIIDIHKEVFSDYPDPLALFPFRSDGHYNETGYTLIGKKILNLLNKP